jgi:hypothetical protein
MTFEWLRQSVFTFWELIRTPFLHGELIWAIVPLYFGWLVNEFTSSKANFSTAIQTGFSFVWAAAHWIYQSFSDRSLSSLKLHPNSLFAVNVLFTVLILLIGVASLISGIRRKYPKYCSFLGHTRFSNYFMIAIFPIQSNYLAWSWSRFIAILVFAIPIWMLFNLALIPFRRKGR